MGGIIDTNIDPVEFAEQEELKFMEQAESKTSPQTGNKQSQSKNGLSSKERVAKKPQKINSKNCESDKHIAHLSVAD